MKQISTLYITNDLYAPIYELSPNHYLIEARSRLLQDEEPITLYEASNIDYLIFLTEIDQYVYKAYTHFAKLMDDRYHEKMRLYSKEQYKLRKAKGIKY